MPPLDASDEALPSLPALLEALRGTSSAAAAAAAAEVVSLSGRVVVRDALLAAGVVPALATLLATSSARSAAARGAARALAVLAASMPEAAAQLVASGALPPLVALASAPPGDDGAAAAAAALWHACADSPTRREAVWAAGAGPRLVALLAGGTACEASVTAASALGELVAESATMREALRDAGGVAALTHALAPGLDSALGSKAVAALLRMSHTEALRPCLADAGRACWKLVNGLGVVEDPGNERARPGARLQALLLMGMLFCVGKDGNRAAGKMLNRFDVARHVTALLSASFKAPDRKYLGVKWSPFEAVLYVRVLAENEDFTDRLSDAGAHGLLAELLASGAAGTSPLLHAAVGMLHMASRDIAHVTVREVKAAEDALAACREMLEVPVQTAMLAMCCAAPQRQQVDHDGPAAGGAGADDVAAAGAATSSSPRVPPVRGLSRGSSIGAMPAWIAGGETGSPVSRA